MPTQQTRPPLFRAPRHTLRHLGLIVVAYVLYGALLLGTSAIIADPEQTATRMPQHFLPEMLLGDSMAPAERLSAGDLQLDSAAH